MFLTKISSYQFLIYNVVEPLRDNDTHISDSGSNTHEELQVISVTWTYVYHIIYHNALKAQPKYFMVALYTFSQLNINFANFTQLKENNL